MKGNGRRKLRKENGKETRKQGRNNDILDYFAKVNFFRMIDFKVKKNH